MLALRTRPTRAPAMPEADVCLIVEGCYPYVPGGVASWIDWLIRANPDMTFCVTALVARNSARKPRYQAPPNLLGVSDLVLDPEVPPAGLRTPHVPDAAAEVMERALRELLSGRGLPSLARLMAEVAPAGTGVRFADLARSRELLTIVGRAYREIAPQLSFLQFYWACRTLLAGVLAILEQPLPAARVYHAVSTGYAGLLAARAALARGRPAVLTEHGVYSIERRIDLLLADWIADTLDKDPGLDTARADLRELWARAFDSLARVCYANASAVTTLYQDNQFTQIELGAGGRRLEVIGNGIDVARFTSLAQAGTDLPPTIALIGRVVPIKDVKTFIRAVAAVRARVPAVQALVLGPTDEDPVYFEACRALVQAHDLAGVITFTGNVKLIEYLPRVHVVALTSLSEAQPLVLLEAGAAGIPCVATDVGACREILEGRADEVPGFGRGGYVAGLGSVEDVAAAICRLLEDDAHRRELGLNLRRRVEACYGSARASARYTSLYREMLARTRHGAPASAGPAYEVARC